MAIWEANEHGTDEQFEDLAYSIVNILTQIRGFEANPNNLVGASRLLSVELRKLLLSDGLQRCVDRPMLHKLIRPDRLVGDPHEQVLDVQGGTLTLTKLDEPMAGQQAVVFTAPVKYETVVYPLYGLRYEKSRARWVSDSPFDESLKPLRLDRWLKQPVLRIDRDQYDMRAMLFEVANTQGAHSDHQRDIIRRQVKEHYRSAYLNIFVLMVSIYLQNQFAYSLAADSSLKSRLATVYPKIGEDAQYKVEASLLFEEDQFSAHIGLATIPFQSVTQEQSLIGGLPETASVPVMSEPMLFKTTISVPLS